MIGRVRALRQTFPTREAFPAGKAKPDFPEEAALARSYVRPSFQIRNPKSEARKKTPSMKFK
jgi:hypothetical protein